MLISSCKNEDNSESDFQKDQTDIETLDTTNYLLKFEPNVSFEDFIIDSIYKGSKSPIDYGSNPTAKSFKTVLTNDYKSTDINFGGHYTFIYWGCGSPCQQSAMVDWLDGKVYDGPVAGLGFDFRSNSKMLIVNPPDSSGFYEICGYCTPEIWIWDEKEKKFERLK